VSLDHAQRNGLGTDRSQGNGTFTYKLTKLAPAASHGKGSES
jgi:hypothetical protein